MRLFLTVLLGLALSACATSALVTGTPRPPIDRSQVRIYFQAPPGDYEENARLETSSGAFTYGEQNKMDSVVAKLRKDADRLGANGVRAEEHTSELQSLMHISSADFCLNKQQLITN